MQMPQWNICGAVVAKLNELPDKKKKNSEWPSWKNWNEIEMDGCEMGESRGPDRHKTKFRTIQILMLQFGQRSLTFWPKAVQSLALNNESARGFRNTNDRLQKYFRTLWHCRIFKQGIKFNYSQFINKYIEPLFYWNDL